MSFGIRALELVLSSADVAARGAEKAPPSKWKFMSEADRVFSRYTDHGAQTSSGDSERRFIVSAPRKDSSGERKTRVVEVVHLRPSRTRPIEDRPKPTPRNVHAETWPDGFRAKPALPIARQDIPHDAPAPAQLAVHIMPMWEPLSGQPAHPAAQLAEVLVEAPVIKHRKPRAAKPHTSTMRARQFADPFADDEGGANCIRCGYLVEQAREKRGLMTCSECG